LAQGGRRGARELGQKKKKKKKSELPRGDYALGQVNLINVKEKSNAGKFGKQLV